VGTGHLGNEEGDAIVEAANPYLNFDGNALEAFSFYKSVFGGDFAVVVRYKDMGGGPPGAPASDLERIAHIALPFGKGDMLMASDVMPSMGDRLTVGNNFYIALAPESAEEAKRLFDGLAAGGSIEMPLQQTQWAEKYGSLKDRFGVQWMVSYTGSVQFSPGG
jgi:PhnB protein